MHEKCPQGDFFYRIVCARHTRGHRTLRDRGDYSTCCSPALCLWALCPAQITSISMLRGENTSSQPWISRHLERAVVQVKLVLADSLQVAEDVVRVLAVLGRLC